MNFIECWFRVMILFQLISVSLSLPTPEITHIRIMGAIRNGNVLEMERVVENHSERFEKFRVEYWALAMRLWKGSPYSEDRKDIIRILIDQLVDKNEQSNGMTPLTCAVLFGNRAAVNKVARVADVDKSNKRGQTALIFAIRLGLLEIAEDLLYFGADANIFDYKKKSALHYACELDDMEIRERAIFLLLSNYAQVSIMNFPYKIKYERCDISRILSRDLVSVNWNSDELMVLRIKQEIEEFGLTLASAMFMLFLASLSQNII